jgi:hypothetical protein
MWVYARDWLSRRLPLNEMAGLWLDYWLFLHAADAHPIWRSRPLGLKSVARMLLNRRTASDGTLRVQLKREMALLVANS